jgi:TatA/E family protein of Tat protein translocase
VTTEGPSLDGIVLDDVDLNDLEAWEEGVPYAWLTLLRHEAPLFWQPEEQGRGYWVFTRYDDIVQVSKDWESYSSELGGTSLEDLTPEEVEARKSMLDTDPPAHTRLRALVNKGFTPRVVNTYEERIRGLAQGILAQAFERDSFDWVEDVASEIPMWVFSEIMGLPVDDRRLLIELGDKLLGNTDPEVVGEENVRDLAATDPSIRLQPFSSPFAADLIEYGCRLGAARRTDPERRPKAQESPTSPEELSMPDVSPIQLIIVMIIALVVLGPKRLPEMGKSLGKGIREFKQSVSGDEHPPLPAPIPPAETTRQS